MELTFKKQDLLASLVAISGSVFKYVLIKSEDKTTLTASNDVFAIESICESDIKKPGEICVDYGKLFRFTKNYSGDEINITKTKAGWMNISGKSIKLRLPGLPPDNFPVAQFQDLPNSIKFSAEQFKAGIDFIESSCGQNKAREALTGICVDIDGGMALTSADSYTIARYRLPCEGEKNRILIPKKTAMEISKIIDSDSVLSFSDRSIQVASNKIRFKSVLLEADYPNLTPIMQHASKNKAKLSKSELSSLIDIMDMIASAESDAVIKMIFDDNKINITSKKLDTGDGDATIDCEYTGEKREIGANLHFLKRLVSIHAKIKDDDIVIETSENNQPIIIRTESEPNLKTIMMPAILGW